MKRITLNPDFALACPHARLVTVEIDEERGSATPEAGAVSAANGARQFGRERREASLCMLPIRSIWGRPDLEIADVSADRVLEGFPELAHDNEVDACSGALEMLNPRMKS